MIETATSVVFATAAVYIILMLVSGMSFVGARSRSVSVTRERGKISKMCTSNDDWSLHTAKLTPLSAAEAVVDAEELAA